MGALHRLLTAIARHSYCLNSFRDLQAVPGNELICPVYHLCRRSAPSWWSQRYPIKSPKQFEQDLDFLATLVPFISLHDLIDWKKGNRDKPRGCFLSFDDGYREISDVIAPILRRKGIPATFFLVSSILNNSAVFHEDLSGLIKIRMTSASAAESQKLTGTFEKHKTSAEQVAGARTPNWSLLNEICAILDLNYQEWLTSEQPYLTSAQVEKLIVDGFTIGSHSMDHPLFKDINDQQKLEQITCSTDAISTQFSLNYRAFAFPYGEFGIDFNFLQQLQASQCVDICFGTRGITIDEFEPFLIQRVLAEGHRGTFRNHIHREMRLQKHRAKTQRATVKRPRLTA